MAFTPDHRNLLITSHKLSLKALWNKLPTPNRRNFKGSASGTEPSFDSPGTTGNNNSSTSSNNSNVKVISLEAIDRIQRGATSHRFLLARREAELEQSHHVLQLLNQNQTHEGTSSSSQPLSCLTVVYLVLATPSTTTASSTSSSSTGTSSTSKWTLETLDLVIPDPGDCEAFLTALEDLTALHREERRKTSATLQRLHSVWLELGKAWHEPLGHNDFLNVCDKLQVPLKRGVLSILFKEEVSGGSGSGSATKGGGGGNGNSRQGNARGNNGNGNGNGSDKLSFVAVATLLESIHKSSLPGENVVLERIWQELLDTDPVPPVKVSTYALPPETHTRSHNNNSNSHEGASALELHIPHSSASSEESISAVAFLSFLRSQQKEFQTSLEEATDLVHILNQQVTLEDLLLQQQQHNGSAAFASSSAAALPRATTSSSHCTGHHDRLTKSRFFAFLASDANDLLHPSLGKLGADDMTQPLSHYWIHSSHDTYLQGLPHSLHTSARHGKASPFQSLIQNSGAASSASGSAGGAGSGTGHGRRQWDVDEQQYMAALLRGVRCLELDVWDGLDGLEPVVARCQPTHPADKRLPLHAILRVVASFLDQHPHSFPILLKLENHVQTPAVQQRLAKLLQDVLRDKLAKPSLDQQLDTPVTLPSPEALRGKVVVLGKRPKKLFHGAMVCQDEYDADNDSFHALEKLREASSNSGAAVASLLSSASLPEEEGDFRVVVGFTPKGPVRAALGSNAPAKTPHELLQEAVQEWKAAQYEVEQCTEDARMRDAAADAAETQAAHYTHLSGWTPSQVKQRALQMQRGLSPRGLDDEEEKSTKEEGLEVHEVLPEFVEGSRGRYESAAREAMEEAGREAQCHALFKDKENALLMARDNLEMARQREQSLSENARRARNDALAHQEHAEAAKERVVKVRDLLRNSKDQTSTAGTVVQTALTEAKISEKRAADAEARANRAQLAADNDRKRADEETRKEEALEMQVNEMHDECMKATEATRAARERVEKAASMLERVNDQLKIIETSSQYRSEVQASSLKDGYNVPRGGSFIAKHTSKLEEREMCRELIREASEENAAAESHRKELQQEFEDRAYQWRVQADQAAQARRAADRSLHLAEELMEQAEEEREAANLRHTARQRAEATVENKDSYRASLEAQLVEAERAAAEAATLALQSKKRSDHLAKEADKVKDHSRFAKAVEDLEWERDVAKREYEAARAEREKKDRAMVDEKRRLDTNAEVYQEAAREAAAETDRTRDELHYQHEAVVTYGEALVLRREASDALDKLESLKLQAETKKLSVERAKEYKARMDTMKEIPVDLARSTLLHSSKHFNWSTSMSLSNAHVHSFAHNVLLLMLDKNPEEERRNLHSFTKNHLTRIFPSWKALQNKSFANYDPVFAWSLGCQLVSCNLHSPDESLLIADGRFRQNGSCGYVLKPPYLTDNASKVENDQRWSVQIVSGQHLPRPSSRKVAGPASPLVKISIYSGSAKETRISYRTKPVRRAGLHPVWTTNNKFEVVIPNPSVSMVAFSVWHAMDDGGESFMGAACLPASGLREGIRSVALFDEHHSRPGEYQTASLLIRTTRK